MVPEWLAGVYVGDVYLYRRGRNGRQGVGQGNAGVSKRTGVDHDAIDRKTQFVNFIEQFPFVVRLKIPKLHVGELHLYGLQVVHERAAAINVRFTLAEQIQVRAVDNEDGFHVAKLYKLV